MWRLQIVDTHFTSPIQLQIFFDKYILNSIDTFPLAHWSLYEIIDRSPFCVYHFPFWSIVTHSYLRIIFHSKSQLYIFVCTRFYKYDSVWLYQTFSSPFSVQGSDFPRHQVGCSIHCFYSPHLFLWNTLVESLQDSLLIGVAFQNQQKSGWPSCPSCFVGREILAVTLRCHQTGLENPRWRFSWENQL